jgi:hypothetical protein
MSDQCTLVEAEFRLPLGASDPNPGDVLSFTVDNLPRGAAFDLDSATWTWMPEANQLGVHSNMLFVVSDGVRSDFAYMLIEIVDEPILPDPRTVWWVKYFIESELDNPGISAEQAGPDGDTMTNSQELEADTNPGDASSLLKIVKMMLLPDDIEIHWIGGVEANQFLEKRILLNGPESWEVIDTGAVPATLSNAVKGEFADESSCFYRIRAIRP